MDQPERSDSEGEIRIDRDLLVQVFTGEAAEILAAMEQGALALEQHPDDDERLHALFRAVHTLKGSASLVAFDAVCGLAHALEGLLELLRERKLRAGKAEVNLLLSAIDVLRAAVPEEAAGREAPPQVADLGARLAQAVAACTAKQAPGPAASPPPAAPPGEDGSDPSGPPAPVPSRRGPRTLRVDVGRLDRMLDLAGEIGIARGRLDDMLERGTSRSPEELLAVHREADRLHQDLQELIMQARMVPLGPTFEQHRRTVRDLAAAQGKQVRLVLEGEDVEVDTSMVEGIRDPLTHMVRNAIDHGLGTPVERAAQGKDPCGTVTIRAFHEHGLVAIQVADDGRGLERERILRRAVERRLVPEGAVPSDQEVWSFIYEPGFSTRDQVTELSGRGVGMDVVRRNVEALRGSIAVESEPGRGTRITLRVPLTLAIIEGFRVQVAGEVYILPLETVAECVELPPGQVEGRTGVIDLRGKPLPYLRLREHFALRGEPPGRENVVVVRHAGAAVGLAVDALLGESQTVLKPLGRLFRGVRGVSGSTILGDGRVALILDVAALLREVLSRSAAAA